MGVWGAWGCRGCHMHVHTCTHTHMHMYKHDNFMQMAAPIVVNGFPQGIPIMTSSHVCMHICACTCTCA